MSWEDIGKRAQAKVFESIPPEWHLPSDKLPPADQADVLDVPYKSGLFSERELLITTSSATNIVEAIASGGWKAVEVTRAFCKRAAIAHQLVRYAPHFSKGAVSVDSFTDELPYCDHVRRCHPASTTAG